MTLYELRRSARKLVGQELTAKMMKEYRDDGEARYLAACLRHLVDHIEGRQEDEESGLPAIDHALIDLMFAIWHMRQE